MVKMVHGICALLLLLVLTGQAFVQTAKTAQISLIEAGEFFYEGVNVKNGERWLGLYVTEGGSSLVESRVTVKPLLDEEDKTQAIGKIVGVDNPVKPLFLVKGATMLRPGPALTIYRDSESEEALLNSDNLASRKSRQLKLGDQEYQLNVEVLAPKTCPGDNPYPCVDIKLALVSGKQTQTLYSHENIPSAEADGGLWPPIVWSLLWAGDADGDGKVDLYLSDGSQTELFLSSQARPGQLIKSVATFSLGAP
jgi:hypothetical protein